MTQPACPSDHINARSRGDCLAEISSSRRWRDVVSAASNPIVTSRAGANRLLRTEPQVRLTNLFSYRTITGTSSLFHTHALPLVVTRILRLRIGRGGGAEFPRHISHSWPWPRPVHGLDAAGNRTRTGTFHVRKQSVFAFSPRQQSWSRTIQVRAQATASIVRGQAVAADAKCPQTVRSCELSTSANASRTQSVHERGLARNYPHHGLTASILPPIRFPIHIQPVPAYALI